MPSFGKRVDVPGGLRRNARTPVALTGFAVTLHRSRPVVIQEISSGGAKLRGRRLPAKGDEFLLQIGSTALLAIVAWESDGECGVRFDIPLEAAELRQFKYDGRQGAALSIL